MLFIKSDWNDLISKILWAPTILLLSVHTAAIYGIYLSITSAKWQTFIIVYILGKNLFSFLFISFQNIYYKNIFRHSISHIMCLI